MLEPHALDYNEFSERIMSIVSSTAQWHRVVSIDLETKIEKKSDFLTGERLLGIGLSRRVGTTVETRALWLKVPFLAPSSFNGPQLTEVFRSNGDVKDWLGRLHQLGVTHLLICSSEWQRLARAVRLG